MKQTKILMGMPVTVEIVDSDLTGVGLHDGGLFSKVFAYFKYIDKKFSVYKKNSEITLINEGKIKKGGYSKDMKTVFVLSDRTREETDGYFNILRDGKYNPSGLVKGWAIFNAARILEKEGCKNFYIEAGGDIQVHGKNRQGKLWRVGIRHPFKQNEIIKAVSLTGQGIATSGTYIRGKHIYNPKRNLAADEIVSLTIIGPNVFEADRFATAAFAMGKNGIVFIENLKDFEGYMIDKEGLATLTSGFERYAVKNG